MTSLVEESPFMQILKELESKLTVSKSGKEKKRRYAIFLCPICSKGVERERCNGLKSDTCGKGCKDNGCTKHKMCGTALYTIWNNMVQRCTNSKRDDYTYYGGKGITIPALWETFEGFFSEMGIGYKEGLSIDRIDPNKPYSAQNCQWITIELNRIKDVIKTIGKYTKDGEYLVSYESSHEASRQEYPEVLDVKKQRALANSIARVARNERKSYRGYVWRYI